MHAGGRKPRNRVPSTVGPDRCNSKLQKEYAAGASLNHRPVNSLKTALKILFSWLRQLRARTSELHLVLYSRTPLPYRRPAGDSDNL